MPNHRSTTTRAVLVGAVLAFAVVSVGCAGRPGLPAAALGPTPRPSVEVVAAPDLMAIQQLLDQADVDLDADATADTVEGSTP
jgi:hypothetical protein